MTAITDRIGKFNDHLPHEMPLRAAQGFVATAAISLCLGSAIPVVLLGGAIAAAATIIEGVSRPIFRALFSENPVFAFLVGAVIAPPIALGLAASLAPWIGMSYRVSSFLFPVLASVVLNTALSDPKDHSSPFPGWAYVLA